MLLRRFSSAAHRPPDSLQFLRCCGHGIALAAPIGGLRIIGEAPASLPPALWLLGTLAGAHWTRLRCRLVLGASAFRAWLARAGAGAASADPYFRYSTSNVGSAGALLAYPFLLEPFLGLESDKRGFRAPSALGLCPLSPRAVASIGVWSQGGPGRDFWHFESTQDTAGGARPRAVRTVPSILHESR